MWREGGAKSDECVVAIGMGNEIWCYVWTRAFLRNISIVRCRRVPRLESLGRFDERGVLEFRSGLVYKGRHTQFL
jgi:hypothetical protein